MKNDVKKTIIWLIAICMLMPFAMPIFAYADSGNWSLTVGDTTTALSITPYENELGLMVDAADLAKAFSFDYEFDSKNKSFTINDDIHGKVMMMHNATQFYSGDKTYECAPYFYVENGVPMIEAEFFCTMFGASCETYGNNITIIPNKLSDSMARLTINDTAMPLYIEPYRNELGLIVSIEDLARAFGIECNINYEDKSATLIDEKYGMIVLNNRAESFTSEFGEYKCLPYYFVDGNTALIEVGFFCEMYGASYNYNEEEKNLSIYKDVPMYNHEREISLMSTSMSATSSDATLSGTVTCSKVNLLGGIDVKLILQQTGTRYVLYQGYQPVTGSTYILGTVHLDSGEQYKNYSYDVSRYYSSNYPTYSLFFEETEASVYGYYNNQGTTTKLTSSPMYTSTYYPSSKKFSSASSETADISLDGAIPTLSGTVSPEEGAVIPASGIDVDLILQTRSALYTWSSVYGYSHSSYTIGKTYTLGTTHISQGNESKDYNYLLLPYYTDSKYPLYTLFYSSTDNDCVEPYGYYGYDTCMTAIDVPPLYSNIQYLNSRGMVLNSESTANIVLPLKSSSSGEKAVKKPTANIDSGNILQGTTITLSCETDDVTIYYTTDGTDPNPSNARYTSGITVNYPITLKAIAVKSGVGNSDIATYAYKTISRTSPLITVGSDIGKPGQTVDVNAALSNNPGIASMRLKVEYNSDALTLIGVLDSGKLGNQMHSNNYGQKPYILYWNNGLATENYVADGDIVTLKFKIDDNAKECDYPVTVSYDNANDDIFDINLEPVDFSVINGKVTVSEAIADTFVNAEITECTFMNNKLTTDIKFSSCLTDCTAILAIYENNGKLLGMAMQAVSAGETKTTLELDSEKNLIGKEVQVFFWKSLGTMKPVGDALKSVVTEQ